MPSHDPLLLDRTEGEDADVAVAMAMVIEDSPRKNTSAVLTITCASIVVYLDISPPIVPPYPILDLVPISDHKAADHLSDKSIPFQKKEWRNCHLKMKAN